MSRRRKKRKGMGTVVFLALVIVVCAIVLGGLVRGGFTDNIKSAINEKMTEQVLEQAVLQALENSGYPEASAKAKEIVGSMDEAAKKEATEIVQKYADKDTLSDLVNIMDDGINSDSVEQLKEYLKENVSEEDIQKLQELYQKYAEQVP